MTDGKTPMYVRAGFYVRQERTLVSCSVARGVGMPGSVLWSGGWSLGLGAHDLAGVAPREFPEALMRAFLVGEDLRPMSPAAKAAWIRSWRATG
jgi:hypothetical protein